MLNPETSRVGRFFRYWAQDACRKMIGESLREIGVLMLVFVPLDGFVRQAAEQPMLISTPYLRRLNVFGKSNLEICMFAVFGIVLILLGIYIEREAELALDHQTVREKSDAGSHGHI